MPLNVRKEVFGETPNTACETHALPNYFVRLAKIANQSSGHFNRTDEKDIVSNYLYFLGRYNSYDHRNYQIWNLEEIMRL
jgi:hypothetical protein